MAGERHWDLGSDVFTTRLHFKKCLSHPQGIFGGLLLRAVVYFPHLNSKLNKQSFNIVV